jgi:hypothetical protein
VIDFIVIDLDALSDPFTYDLLNFRGDANDFLFLLIKGVFLDFLADKFWLVLT